MTKQERTEMRELQKRVSVLEQILENVLDTLSELLPETNVEKWETLQDDIATLAFLFPTENTNQLNLFNFEGGEGERGER